MNVDWEQIEEEWDGVERRIAARRVTDRRLRERRKLLSRDIDEDFSERRKEEDRRQHRDRRENDRRRVKHDYDQTNS